MNSVMNIALSGMQAAVVRAANSANNIANAQSTSTIKDGVVSNEPFMPLDIIQISDPNGGTIAYTQESDKEPINLYDPVTGFEQVPNIDLAEELVKTQAAAVDYKANLQVINYAQNIQRSLIDIFV